MLRASKDTLGVVFPIVSVNWHSGAIAHQKIDWNNSERCLAPGKATSNALSVTLATLSSTIIILYFIDLHHPTN